MISTHRRGAVGALCRPRRSPISSRAQAAAKLTVADGCTCTSQGTDIGYPCPAPQAIVPGGYKLTCTLPEQNIQVRPRSLEQWGADAAGCA